MKKYYGDKKRRRLGKTGKTVIVILLAYIAVIAAVSVTLDARSVRFHMTMAQEIDVEYGEEYIDPGCYASTSGRVFGTSERRIEVKTSGSVDTSKLGVYSVKYYVRYFFREYSVTRTVNVVDTAAPVIQLKYIDGYEPNWFTGYEEEGYTASDNHDGDITDRVKFEMRGDTIVYTVADSSGNVSNVERHPSYSISAPELVLKGDAYMELYASPSFSDPGFTAIDNRGNDLSEHVQVESNVCAYLAGDYEINYSVSNAAGETISAKRTVKILPVELPETVMPGEKTIYLTFDDGPGPYTGDLLDILSYYNVKATFFVTCLNSKYEDEIGRAYNEGHSIGVHTATHNYYEIYASENAFFDDFYLVEDLIYEQTGEYTELCRFPGGSSNTVSSFNPGIITRLARSLTDMGYRYFDWNVSSGDAGETTSRDQVAENVIAGCSGKTASVVLQHDIKDYSVAAVEEIIVWGLSNGYTFRALDITSPEAHHKIAN